MAKKAERPASHPDELMTVSICLTLQAKPNPHADDPPPFHTTELEQTFRAADAADFLDKVVGAVRERRVYGFMLQEQAESAVRAGQWIEMTAEEIIAEATANKGVVRFPNVQRIKLRDDD